MEKRRQAAALRRTRIALMRLLMLLYASRALCVSAGRAAAHRTRRLRTPCLINHFSLFYNRHLPLRTFTAPARHLPARTCASFRRTSLRRVVGGPACAAGGDNSNGLGGRQAFSLRTCGAHCLAYSHALARRRGAWAIRGRAWRTGGDGRQDLKLRCLLHAVPHLCAAPAKWRRYRMLDRAPHWAARVAA
jgi:hypothetical protein